mmetsp:Transcript_108647/g.339825  ORF Transcript_108647/g.339825 Transcript_108647/m.339825 type:complete len:276 (+) Transcript_108647:401-1228(+)
MDRSQHAGPARWRRGRLPGRTSGGAGGFPAQGSRPRTTASSGLSAPFCRRVAMFSFGACNACRGNSNQQTDTVKVSFSPKADACDKENAGPNMAIPQSPKLAEAKEEQRPREQEEAEEDRRRQEALERARIEREEQQRREEEERLRQLELERQRAAEEEERRAREEAERQRQQEEEDARRRAEEARRRKLVEEFLSKNGFAGVNERKKKSGTFSSGFTYPLHAAVKAKDAQAVELLLWAGADKELKDSAKLTPLALAQKLDKKGSHKSVVDALSA